MCQIEQMLVFLLDAIREELFTIKKLYDRLDEIRTDNYGHLQKIKSCLLTKENFTINRAYQLKTGIHKLYSLIIGTVNRPETAITGCLFSPKFI